MRITANILHYNCEKLLYQTIDSVLMPYPQPPDHACAHAD